MTLPSVDASPSSHAASTSAASAPSASASSSSSSAAVASVNGHTFRNGVEVCDVEDDDDEKRPPALAPSPSAATAAATTTAPALQRQASSVQATSMFHAKAPVEDDVMMQLLELYGLQLYPLQPCFAHLAHVSPVLVF